MCVVSSVLDKAIVTWWFEFSLTTTTECQNKTHNLLQGKTACKFQFYEDFSFGRGVNVGNFKPTSIQLFSKLW